MEDDEKLSFGGLCGYVVATTFQRRDRVVNFRWSSLKSSIRHLKAQGDATTHAQSLYHAAIVKIKSQKARRHNGCGKK
jgi:hypothetical protein